MIGPLGKGPQCPDAATPYSHWMKAVLSVLL